jgi:threonine/homoserine/homoserine lactone efflux protein
MEGVIDMLVMAFFIGLTGALAPGPTLVATVNSSLKSGWTAGPKVAAGHALVELAIFLLIVGGLSAAPQEHSGPISALGGLALIAFGVLTIKGSKDATLTLRGNGDSGNPYLAGVLTSAANPYFWVWWLSIGGAMVLDGLKASMLMGAAFLVGHWCADFGWYIAVSTSLDRGRSMLSEKSYRAILSVCGAFLILFGLYYLSQGLIPLGIMPGPN